jgi:DNA-binding transcriptional ArsR family regulator
VDKNDAIVTLSALAQDTRLDIFRLLVEAGCDGLPAGVIGERLGVPAPTLSFHLKELRRADVVQAERNGRSIVYCAHFAAMHSLVDYLLANCCQGVGLASAAGVSTAACATDAVKPRRARSAGVRHPLQP